MNVLGMPTVVFLESNGTERKDLSLVGFEKADHFLNRMNAVVGESST